MNAVSAPFSSCNHDLDGDTLTVPHSNLHRHIRTVMDSNLYTEIVVPLLRVLETPGSLSLLPPHFARARHFTHLSTFLSGA